MAKSDKKPKKNGPPNEQPDLKSLLGDLKKQIGVCSQMCTTNTEFNSLAYVLLTRALDTLEAVHGDEFYYPLQAIVHDRQLKRRIPTTVEYAKKQLEMRKFLP